MPNKPSGLIKSLLILPWWVNLILAVLVYVGLQWVVPALPIDNRLLKALALGLSEAVWMFTGVLVVMALGSALRSYQHRRLLDRQQGLDSIHALSWTAFEALVAEYYRRKGYTVTDNVSAGADGGVDVTLSKEGQLFLVQCKHWKTRNVGVTIVRELLGVVVAREAAGGMVVTSGEFTTEAIRFARDQSIELIDGHQFAHLVMHVQHTDPGAVLQSPVKPVKPICPRCNRELVLRTARQGRRAGSKFLGVFRVSGMPLYIK